MSETETTTVVMVRAQAGDTIDALCQRHLGRTKGGVVETTLAINPALAAHPHLSPGQLVTLPTSVAIPKNNEINLWD